MIKETIEKLKPERVHLFTQGWFGNPSHINVGYRSADPQVIQRQVVSGMFIAGVAKLSVCVDYYADTWSDQYCLALKRECEARGAEFSIMVDAGSEAHLKLPDLIKRIRASYLVSPAYSKFNGRPMVWSFGLSAVEVAQQQKANPDIMFITENHGLFTYAWPNGFMPGTPESYLSNYLSRHDALMVPTLWRGFDDHKLSDPKRSAWGGPARLMDPGKTGWDLWNKLAALIKPGAYTELGLATLDDYEERTRLEPWITQEWVDGLAAEAQRLGKVNL